MNTNNRQCKQPNNIDSQQNNFCEETEMLNERRGHILQKGKQKDLACDKLSLAGAVSQRACVYSGARVVLNPVTDVCHLVHGPVGCASYTWDIRGALTSGPHLYRKSFSTDLREEDVVFGGEKKLYGAILELVERYRPAAVFVYATCIVGIIGDDIKAVCSQAEKETGTRVVPIQSEGFKGNKAEGYKAACDALFNHVIGKPIRALPDIKAGLLLEDKKSYGPSTKKFAPRDGRFKMESGIAELISAENDSSKSINDGNKYERSINILGEFNVAGDIREIKPLFERLGINVVSVMTGDARFEDIANAHKATLNLVQCSGSMTYLAKKMEKSFGIPFFRVSFFGYDDLIFAIRKIADFFNDAKMAAEAEKIISENLEKFDPAIAKAKKVLTGKKAAIYMGGAAKCLALIRAFNTLGMKTVLVGTQSGKKDEYDEIRELVEDGTVIIDDANPQELKRLLVETGADLLVAGVKERFLAYKLGLGFCDFNHDRTVIYSGFNGFLNFADELMVSLGSPVWSIINRPKAASQKLPEYAKQMQAIGLVDNGKSRESICDGHDKNAIERQRGCA